MCLNLGNIFETIAHCIKKANSISHLRYQIHIISISLLVTLLVRSVSPSPSEFHCTPVVVTKYVSFMMSSTSFSRSSSDSLSLFSVGRGRRRRGRERRRRKRRSTPLMPGLGLLPGEPSKHTLLTSYIFHLHREHPSWPLIFVSFFFNCILSPS